MAVTSEGINKAEFWQCVEVDGAFVKPLNWAFVRFADAGEERRFVTPASNWLHLSGEQPYRVRQEAMRNRAFPHEADWRRQTTGDEAKEGPVAVHFFGQCYAV